LGFADIILEPRGGLRVPVKQLILRLGAYCQQILHGCGHQLTLRGCEDLEILGTADRLELIASCLDSDFEYLDVVITKALITLAMDL
jgi:predicted nuclease of predicted toxin-antitoxin system